MRLVVAFAGACALASACSGKRADHTAQQCAAAAQHGIDGMIAHAKQRIATSQLPDDVRAKMAERTKQLDELAPRLRAVVTNRCVDDKWKRDVIDCYAKITTMEEMRACRGKLPPEHQAALQREELDLMAGETGPPGFGSAPVPRGATPEIANLEEDLRVANDRLSAAMKAVEAAKDEQARTSAQSQLRAVQQEMEALNAKLAAARARAVTPGPAP